jgi:hypothetical protein
MSRLPHAPLFYILALPISICAGWGYADSFNTVNNASAIAKNFFVQHVDPKYPHISHDSLIMIRIPPSDDKLHQPENTNDKQGLPPRRL